MTTFAEALAVVYREIESIKQKRESINWERVAALEAQAKTLIWAIQTLSPSTAGTPFPLA
jgi:hypothetical protein